MKVSFLILTWLLTSVSASATEPSLQISIGAPTRISAPPGYAVPGSEWLQFPVHASNLSGQPIWLRDFSATAPFYRLFTRPMAAGTWTDCHVRFVGHTTIRADPLAPETMVAFFVSVPAWYAGQQLRVEMDVFASEQTSVPVVTTSEATTIKQQAEPSQTLQPTSGAATFPGKFRLDLRPGGG